MKLTLSMILLLISLTTVGCTKAHRAPEATVETAKPAVVETEPTAKVAQPVVNAPVEVNGEQLLLGPLHYAELLQYFPQWQAQDQAYETDPQLVAALKRVNTPFEVVCYLGSWCGDSRRGVPPFVRMVEAAENPNIHLKLIGVNRQKVDPGQTAPPLDIQRVPTFLIYENGQEIGRLIEFPLTSNFVEDFLEVVNVE